MITEKFRKLFIERLGKNTKYAKNVKENLAKKNIQIAETTIRDVFNGKSSNFNVAKEIINFFNIENQKIVELENEQQKIIAENTK